MALWILESYVVLLDASDIRNVKGCTVPPPYLDDYGETDPGLRYVCNVATISLIWMTMGRLTLVLGINSPSLSGQLWGPSLGRVASLSSYVLI